MGAGGRERRKAYSRAEREAKAELMRRHQSEYDGLLLARLRAAGITPKKLLRGSRVDPVTRLVEGFHGRD